MKKLLTLLFILVLKNSYPQLLPINNSIIKQTQVMFQYPQIKGADYYKLEISTINGLYSDSTNVLTTTDFHTAHLITNLLNFGNQYYWRYSAISKNKTIFHSQQNNFTIAQTQLARCFKANVTKNDSAKIEQGLVFLDNGLVIDRTGKLILFTDNFGSEKRDFSLTDENTLTYVLNSTATETYLDGLIKWQSSEIETKDYKLYGFHHDLIKLRNGNYLLLCKIKLKSQSIKKPLLDEAIIELTQNNEVVWSWLEKDFLPDTTSLVKTHLNSIYYDETLNQIMVSARDINTVFFIDKLSKKIVKSIGYPISSSPENYSQTLFSGQHSAQLTPKNAILLFNNNTKFGKNSASTILEIKQPTKTNSTVNSDFLYTYQFEEEDQNYCAKGGDVNKLENGNYLISSSANNRNFEINNSSVVWECKPQKFDSISGLWLDIGSYRINFYKTLYPLFFCLETHYENGIAEGFKIVNKGSDNNQFEILIKSRHSKKIIRKTVRINSQESIIEKIKIKKGKEYEVTIFPINKAHLKKVLVLKL